MIFVICSRAYWKTVLEAYEGREDVYLPGRDTPQILGREWETVQANLEAIKKADEVHLWWDGTSQGALVDLGMALALGKKIIVKKFNSRTWGARLPSVLASREQERG